MSARERQIAATNRVLDLSLSLDSERFGLLAWRTLLVLAGSMPAALETALDRAEALTPPIERSAS